MTGVVYFIRHAESIYNCYGVDEVDCGITVNGGYMARRLNFQVDLVICSTLKRARQTLDFSNISYKEVIFTDLCRESRNGKRSNYLLNETLVVDDVKARALEFKEYLLDLLLVHPTIAVITHHGFLSCYGYKTVENCGVVKLVRRPIIEP